MQCTLRNLPFFFYALLNCVVFFLQIYFSKCISSLFAFATHFVVSFKFSIFREFLLFFEFLLTPLTPKQLNRLQNVLRHAAVKVVIHRSRSRMNTSPPESIFFKKKSHYPFIRKLHRFPSRQDSIRQSFLSFASHFYFYASLKHLELNFILRSSCSLRIGFTLIPSYDKKKTLFDICCCVFIFYHKTNRVLPQIHFFHLFTFQLCFIMVSFYVFFLFKLT